MKDIRYMHPRLWTAACSHVSHSSPWVGSHSPDFSEEQQLQRKHQSLPLQQDSDTDRLPGRAQTEIDFSYLNDWPYATYKWTLNYKPSFLKHNDNVVFISSLITLPYPYTVLPEGQADWNCALILSLLPMFHYWHMSHGSWKPFTLPNTCLHHKVSGIFLLFYVLKYFTEFYNYITFPFFSPSTSQLPLLKHFPCPTQVNNLFLLSYYWYIHICVYIYVYAQIYL